MRPPISCSRRVRERAVDRPGGDRERHRRLEPAADDCGAQDWSVLDQRMHYLVHLFRAYHDEEVLASPPFTPAQVERIRAGALPDGEL